MANRSFYNLVIRLGYIFQTVARRKTCLIRLQKPRNIPRISITSTANDFEKTIGIYVRPIDHVKLDTIITV